MKNLIEKHARVIYDKGMECLLVQFSGFITYEELVKVLQYEFQMVQFYKVTKCIVDLKSMMVYPSGGKEYIKDIWFPHMESNGIQHVAVVVPENVFGEASMLMAHKQAEDYKKLQTRHFREIEMALKWIREVKGFADYVA